MRIFYKGFNFSQDGPGNRLVYHLQGCNLRCPWCSNPEGMAASGGCEYSTEDIVAESKSCRPMFFSGGGVTFTGGEATVQADALTDALRALRREGIHTALETNGTSPRLPEIEKEVDYLIMDLKHYDAEAYRRFCGASVEPVLKNFAYLCVSGRQLHVRIPLINGFNADGAAGFCAYLSRFDTKNIVFELLPYHEYGKEKWKTEYRMKSAFVTKEQIHAFTEAFSDMGLKIVNT